MKICTKEERFRYRLKAERDRPDATVFLLRPLSYAVSKKWRGRMAAAETDEANTDLMVDCLAEDGCDGWESCHPLTNMAGEPVTYEGKATLEMLPLAVLTELFQALSSFNGVQEDDEGNSE